MSGGFAAVTPQRSGAATTSASVWEALGLSPRTSADVFLPSARFARSPQILQLSGMRPQQNRSTDEQQPRRRAESGDGSPMNAGRHRAAGVFCGDPPEIAKAKGERLRPRPWGVVEIVEMVV